jgi:hypothetical protein
MSDRTALISRSSAPHYTWAKACDGWRLIDTPGLSVVEERVPPGAEESVTITMKRGSSFMCFQAPRFLEPKKGSIKFQPVPELKWPPVSTTNS